MKIFKCIVNIVRRFVAHAGVYFMLTVLLLNALGGEGRTFSPDYFGIAVLFGALLSMCDFVLDAKFISSALARSAIHVVIATASFAVSFVLAAGILEGSTGFIASAAFLVVDCVALAVRGIYLSLTKDKGAEEK